MSDAGSSIQYQRSQGSQSDVSGMSIDDDYVPEYNLGMRPDIKQFYRPDDQSAWAEWAPNAAPNTDIEASSYAQECAIIVRRESDLTNKNRMSLHSITVQSPWIKKVLDITFEGYESLNTRLKHLTFKAPFHPFYYRWHKFQKLRRDEQRSGTKKHLDLLHSALSEQIQPHIDAMEDYTKNKVISFEYLWAIFSPGMLIHTLIDGQDRILSLRDSRYMANMSGEYLTLECRYIDCDGLSFGYVSTSLDIGSFDGVKKLTDLDTMPAHLHPNAESLVNQLLARGEKLEQLNGFHHVSYSGFYTARSSKQVRKRHVENSRIIIDPQTFNIFGNASPHLESLDSIIDEGPAFDTTNGGNVIYQATHSDLQRFCKALMSGQGSKKHTKEPSRSRSLSLKQRLLCTPMVTGYSLASRTWAEFYVEGIVPIQWREDAFSRLVLPPGYKDIIYAFVREQLSQDDDFGDVIFGKGLGFIMCLTGPPGVGKTLTAESVAEEMRQPLYLMSAGELGETAADVEESLELVLELSNKWNAILLLDECDLFLSARTTTDIRRNRLVSIFLRKLEYYKGVMFLTTNRIGDMDAAFESRIHLTVNYPDLDVASRLYIWKTSMGLGSYQETRLTEKDLTALAKHEMNGREIKNIVKASRLLSKQKSEPLAMEHIELVLKVKRGEFNGV
ncbi:P-loop containing nucleoside triphosphate hydrolase protein [Xylariaceae sp. FL0255]|nr:P-loop containing nucleoside triphosphate hydrolase protein [Xylariaceae sp. FL0255]